MTPEYKPPKCPVCGKPFNNFCVPCAKRQGLTPQEILASLGLTEIVPYSALCGASMGL